jgi:hypothetical protein
LFIATSSNYQPIKINLQVAGIYFPELSWKWVKLGAAYNRYFTKYIGLEIKQFLCAEPGVCDVANLFVNIDR